MGSWRFIEKSVGAEKCRHAEKSINGVRTTKSEGVEPGLSPAEDLVEIETEIGTH